ncbi:hypothetical protein M0R88_11920 [Halorussus gelatinilyticus]|uniref:Uncharacterized protein n=1 Tax=Halorussus gelatinilyticus TaxID=2937524 RepID=A0A8U0IE61_9EURY|nr:hypothetical protein [Halorussus gelatinilyticus]UPV99232.1 hypothetical protein M0R88_11920 [Halorussus gelatinilyticus]
MRCKVTISVVAIILVSSMISTPVAADDWSDECDSARIIGSGTHSGTIDAYQESDMFRLIMDKGDTAYFEFDVPDGEKDLQIGSWGNNPDTVIFDNIEHATSNSENTYLMNPGIRGFEHGVTASWRIYAKEAGTHCIKLRDAAAKDTVPYDWQIVIEDDGDLATPTPITTRTTTTTTQTTTTTTQTSTTQTTFATPTRTTTRTTMATPTTTIQTNQGGIKDSDGDGMIDSEDYAPRDPDVQEKSDAQGSTDGSMPGFGLEATLIALLLSLIIFHRQD